MLDILDFDVISKNPRLGLSHKAIVPKSKMPAQAAFL